MVVVPSGTRNHLAMDLGLDRRDVVGALDAFGDACEGRIDLGEVNGRVFVNNASLGLYAEIVRSPAYREAKVETASARCPACSDREPARSSCASPARRGSGTPPRTSCRSRTTRTARLPAASRAGRAWTAGCSGCWRSSWPTRRR